MSYRRGTAPHQAEPTYHSDAPNAALLIDFDNVTMAIRSDLGKELKTLLNSDLIRGKVAVQRAYADWRRYPQYIVPLSEASVDLIFAPAYGSSKKNATDLRMAIDGMELVFTRPEIGVFILLTGDSDFSSLVLKLKEYGKYVIGVGMKESSSDILVQNCDEYYSYHSLSGLTRTAKDGVAESAEDPWQLVEQALQRMVANGDVMRSDRLKQVMLDLDSSFDEKKLGYKKFSRFVQDAAERGLVRVRKLESGQHELLVGGGRRAEAAPSGDGRAEERPRRGGRSRDRRPERKEEKAAAPEAAKPAPAPRETAAAPRQDGGTGPSPADDLQSAFALLQRALDDLDARAGNWAGAADVKRRMLEMTPGFDEGDLGFSKFSRFLQKAHDVELVDLERMQGGSYQVVVGAERAKAPLPGEAAPKAEAPAKREAKAAEAEQPAGRDEAAETPPTPAGRDKVAARAARRSRRGGPAGPPPEPLPGQVVGTAGKEKGVDRDKKPAKKKSPARRETPTTAELEPLPPELEKLGLPRDPDSIAAYMANSYKGVGAKTAERIVEAFGNRTFEVLANDPDRLTDVLGAGRARALLEQWAEDRARREQGPEAPGGPTEPASETPAGQSSAEPATPGQAPSPESGGGAGRSRSVSRRGSSRSSRSRS